MLNISLAAGFFATIATQAAVVYPSRPPEQKVTAHDPSILKDGNRYYVYGTHNIPTWQSKDLINFARAEERLVHKIPGAAKEHVGERANDLWAPDIVKAGSEYRLYYCLSQFGTSQSYIGFLVGDSPTGMFSDGAKVISSTQPPEKQGGPNALDPCILADTQGRHWMIYGSFFGGVYILRMDEDSGEAHSKGSVGKRMAFRQSSALEGPCAIYNPELKQYFLFVSYDKLDSTYNVRVGRSSRPDGPYRDFSNADMAGDEDNLPKILNSYAFANHPGWHGPGHNSVLRDGENYFMLHHARIRIDGKKRVRLHVRKMVFTDEGWPVVSPERYAGEQEQSIPANELIGTWEYLLIDPLNNGMQKASNGLVFERYGILRLGALKGRWQVMPPNSLRYQLEKQPVVSAKILPAWDWENDSPTLIFTGLDKAGSAIWGKKIDQAL